MLNTGAGAEFTGAAQRAMGVPSKSCAGLPMRTYAPSVASALLAMHAALGCGCGSGSSVAQAGGPFLASSEPSAAPGGSAASGRAARVAVTSACAQAYGYPHDAVKLRASYLSFEMKQGANRAQLADIEKTYDAAAADAR